MSSTDTAPDQPAIQRFNALRERVRRLGLIDDIADLEPDVDLVQDPRIKGEMARLLGFYWLRRGNFARAVELCDFANTALEGDPDATYNAIFAQFQAGQWEDVVTRAKAAFQRWSNHFEFPNILSTTLGALGRTQEARGFGTQALILKDAAAAAPAFDLTRVPIPPFDPSDPRRNIIAFSLFGANPRYTDGAVLNVRAARFLYLGWTCRFYVDDSVPQPIVRTLMTEGAQVMQVRGLPSEPYGTFWRFLVADDPEVTRYIVRDADSVVNIREKVAVEEWLASARHFHLMRDHYDHSELVLAGMWAGVRGALPPQLPSFQAYLTSPRHILGRTADQEYLRARLWPTIRQSLLTHDSQFAFGERRDFPSVGGLPPEFWVGCDGRKMFGGVTV